MACGVKACWPTVANFTASCIVQYIMFQLRLLMPMQVQDLNMSRHAPDVNRVCSIAGCDDTSLLNQVHSSPG